MLLLVGYVSEPMGYFCCVLPLLEFCFLPDYTTCCFNSSLKSPNLFFHLCLISTLAYRALVKPLGNTSTLLMIHHLLEKFFPVGSIIPVFRRTKNIKDILSSKPREQHRTPDYQRGCFKCDLCRNYFKESNCFTSTSTGRKYPITQILNCKSKNVIYLVTCKKCNL